MMLELRSRTRPATRSATLSAVTLAITLLAGCSTVRPVSHTNDRLEPGGDVITREDIEGSGARDALQAIQRADTHVRIQHTAGTVPTRLTYRGLGTLGLSPDMLVVVDGTPVSVAIRYLETIPASSVDYIQILSGPEASVKWGSQAGNGVILVLTSAGR